MRVMDGEHLSPSEELAFDLYGENPVYAALLNAIHNLGESLYACTHAGGLRPCVPDGV
jgi:hypothetical protein